ncbi:hypothetical protein M758_12G095600 [Ceratodon purpureus]|nr:hypothetical protein M758_12G095600 [Ceratodon purpureus]
MLHLFMVYPDYLTADKSIDAGALPFLNPIPISSGEEFEVHKKSITWVWNMALEIVVYDPQAGEESEFKGLVANLQTTTYGMLEFVSLMKSSYTDLPTSKAAIGKPASKVITALRAQMTNLLLLYNAHHLPLGLDNISILEDTLHKYFLEKSFDRFKTMLPLLQRMLTSSAIRAEAVKDEYVRLASELKKTASEGKAKLGIVEQELDLKRVRANCLKQSASDIKSSMGPVSAVSSAMGGAYLATLLEVSTLLAVSPATAAVMGAGVMGATLYQFANSIADNCEATENELLVVCGKLEQGLEGLRKINKHAISSFAEYINAAANFLDFIATKLKHLLPSDANVDDPDEILKLVHEDTKSDAHALVTVCKLFRACCVQIQVDIQVLSAFQTENTQSYVDEWINNSRQRTILRTYQEASQYWAHSVERRIIVRER